MKQRTALAYILVLALMLAVTLWSISAQETRTQLIIVHTGQSKALLYNPLTHQETRNEMADGNIAVTVRPKVEEVKE